MATGGGVFRYTNNDIGSRARACEVVRSTVKELGRSDQ